MTPVKPLAGQPTIMVPIHLDALLLPMEQAVVAATADFAGLPYFNGQRDVNGATAYLSEMILARPFQNRNLYLPAGVHLHWSLPDALTRAWRPPVTNEDEDPDDIETQNPPAEFPPVPNRWLVVRSGANRAERAWIVESDFLHPEGAGANTGSPTYPHPFKRKRGDERAPFRYLGRVLSFEDWQKQGEQGEYLDSLTAVGYGEPTFAALYANCRNVFGFYDKEVTKAEEGLRYDLVGWYSDVDQDYVRRLATDLRTEDGTTAADQLLALLAQRARWTPQILLQKQQDDATDKLWDEMVARPWLEPLAGDSEHATLLARSWRAGKPLDDRASQEQVAARLEQIEREAIGELTETGQLLCYARLTFAAPASQAVEDKPLQIAIGNTGPQALSVYLADRIARELPELDPHTAGQPTLEDRIEAILLAPRLRDRGIDLDAKFRQARHETGFTALQSGHVWTLLQQPREPGAADAQQTSRQRQIAELLSATELGLLDELSHGLNTLNAAQQAYDRATHVIDTLRQQIFADWYRYMLCLYPVEGAAERYPDIDEVRHYIEQAMLPELKRQVEQTGRLVHRHEQDPWRAPYPVAVERETDSLAAVVDRAATELRGKLDQLNNIEAVQKANLVYKLGRTHAARYWQPNNPVVLLAGEGLQPTLRHGHDGRARLDGMLGCRVISDPVFANGSLTPQSASALIDRLAKGGVDEEIGFFTWTEPPWHPLLLEWEVEVLPMAGRGNLDPQGGLYTSDFITANYAAAENEPDLVVRDGRGVLRPAMNLYSGSSILTPYAQTFHAQRLAAYVLQIYGKDKSLPVPPDEEAVAYLIAHREQVEAWHKDQGHDAEDREDSITVALAAFEQLREIGVLSQSLGGFNEALLTRKQTLQLDVDDPLAFADFWPFIEAVRAAAGHSNSSAPQPLNDFNPIRSGALKLLRLRLVDSFGQTRDLEPGQFLSIHQMRASGSYIALPPRLVQPARLNFRWLSADLGDAQMSRQASETPICGWVVPNHLDNSLLIYDGGGRALGIIDKDGKWGPAPGAPPVEPAAIADDHLRKMVTYLIGRNADFIDAFHRALDSALEQIDPDNYAQHPELALLMGRPLALVRAELSLELQGLPAVHQGWIQFHQDLRRTTRDSDGFTAVQIPIRLGDYRQLNDGLAGYWIEKDDGFGEHFFAPLSDAIDHESIQTHHGGELAILQSLDAPPQTLSMLVDPRGTLHATCGILPVKGIDLPPEQYSDALRRIEVTFGAGPLLTGPRQLGVPLPTEPGYAWSWLERENGGWRQTWTFPTIERAAFAQGLALLLWARLHGGTGAWLRPAADTPAAAELVPAEQRATLAAELAPFQEAIEQVLAQHSTGGVITRDVFVAAAGAMIGGPIWDLLLEPDVGWLVAMPGERPLAQITIKNEGAAKALPAPVYGAEALIESVLDQYQAVILPPSSVARFAGQQEIHEGWLRLRVADQVG